MSGRWLLAGASKSDFGGSSTKIARDVDDEVEGLGLE